MRKLNCWEYKKCGQERKERAGNKGFCPTITITSLNGVHGGTQGGRACWVIEGTLCNGLKKLSFHEKYRTCRDCDFYRMVMQEEGTGFILSAVLFSRLTTDLEERRDGGGNKLDIAA